MKRLILAGAIALLLLPIVAASASATSASSPNIHFLPPAVVAAQHEDGIPDATIEARPGQTIAIPFQLTGNPGDEVWAFLVTNGSQVQIGHFACCGVQQVNVSVPADANHGWSANVLLGIADAAAGSNGNGDPALDVYPGGLLRLFVVADPTIEPGSVDQNVFFPTVRDGWRDYVTYSYGCKVGFTCIDATGPQTTDALVVRDSKQRVVYRGRTASVGYGQRKSAVWDGTDSRHRTVTPGNYFLSIERRTAYETVGSKGVKVVVASRTESVHFTATAMGLGAEYVTPIYEGTCAEHESYVVPDALRLWCFGRNGDTAIARYFFKARDLSRGTILSIKTGKVRVIGYGHYQSAVARTSRAGLTVTVTVGGTDVMDIQKVAVPVEILRRV
jgi:hypothetical protein